MQLTLALADQVVASIPLDKKQKNNLEYLFFQRAQMRDAYASLIASQAVPPVYYIEVPSKMNKGGRRNAVRACA
ncbi:MAG TPA: hypothetical protein VFT06_09840 [Flavisolibacter sp.]|jgi:hypothetical protein|nr:hypothetical protein [Flavisolibacter sp.]